MFKRIKNCSVLSAILAFILMVNASSSALAVSAEGTDNTGQETGEVMQEGATDDSAEEGEESLLQDDGSEAEEPVQNEEPADSGDDTGDDKESDADDAPEQTEAAEAVITETSTVTFEGTLNDIKVIVITEEGVFPEGTEMKLAAVDLEETKDQLIDEIETLEKIVVPAFAVDITFYCDGQEIQPASEIKVQFESALIDPAEEAVVVHIDDEGKCEEKEVTETEDSSLAIETDEFSVYAVTYTVDFHYDDLTYSMAGNTSVRLSEVLTNLNTEIETAYVKEVTFSDTELLTVTKDAEGEDWTLTSLAAFGSDETLTLTLKDDTVIEIKVTDAEIAHQGTSGTVTWTIDTAGNMIFKPTEGDTGTLASITGKTAASWDPYRETVKTVKFEGKIIAGEEMASFFENFYVVESIDFTGLDTSNTKSLYNMFNACLALKSLDLSPLDTSNVTNMKQLFAFCQSLEGIDLSPLKTSKVTSCMYMFYDCSSLKTIDLSRLDMSSNTTFYYMFFQCTSLESVNFGNIDTSNVTNFSYMFRICPALTSVDLSGLDFSKAKTLCYMFNLCSSLSSITWPESLEAGNITDTSYMFMGCESLSELDLSGWSETASLTKAESMFAECESLKTLDISSLNITNCTYFKDFFHDCNSLEKVVLGEKYRFKTADGQLSTGFPRGIWQYDGDNENYPATEIVSLLEQGSMAGAFTKTADHSFTGDFTVGYKINNTSEVIVETSDSNLVKFNEKGDVWTAVDGDAVAEDYAFPATITLTFPDCVEDADGNKYSLKMHYEDIVIHDAKSITSFEKYNNVYTQYYHFFFRMSDEGVPCIRGEDRVSLDVDADPKISTTSEYKITLSIVESNGDPVDGHFMFSIYDLDIPSPMDYGQTWSKSAALSGYTDKAYGYYSEGIYLQDGFDFDTVTAADNTYTWLMGKTGSVSSSNGVRRLNVVNAQPASTIDGYRITGTQVDGSSELTDVLVRADASGSTFVWTGWSCEDFILMRYQPKSIHFDKVDQNGNRISGAKLELYEIITNSDGTESRSAKPIASWTTDASKEHDFNMFMTPGKYVLTETEVPDGYEKAEDIIFIINNDFEVCDENGDNIEGVIDIVKMIDIKEEESISPPTPMPVINHPRIPVPNTSDQ